MLAIMTPPQPPENEDQRLAALLRYEILDTPEDITFDLIVELAAHLCGTNIALISLVDENRQWFKAKYGIGASETKRAGSFCDYALHWEDIFEIPDALKDERFNNNPLVVNEPFIRFYAGYLLHSKEGYKIGTLCVIDDYPRTLSEEQRNSLRILGQQLEQLMSLRYELLQDFQELLSTLLPEQISEQQPSLS